MYVDVAVQMEMFFAQLVGDLSTFAKHAGRVTVEESDVKLLMDRQRITIGASGKSLQDLARQ
jgi:histone H3/H4